MQRLADRAATYLTLIAIFVGGDTFAFWFGIGAGSLFALTLAITVIVITCPHALGLAIPTVTTLSTTIAAKNGMLVRTRQALLPKGNLAYQTLFYWDRPVHNSFFIV